MTEVKTYHHTIRVYAEDVDYMGIVFHANYLRYIERARTEILRTLNLSLSDLKKEDILFAVTDLAIKYIFPATLDDLLEVITEIKEVKACTFVFEQLIKNQQHQLICEVRVKVVCVNGQLKPQKLPNVFKELEIK